MFILLLLVGVALSANEQIPLRGGRSVEGKVIIAGRAALVIQLRSTGEEVSLSWEQVSPDFRLHPAHQPPPTAAEPAAAEEPPVLRLPPPEPEPEPEAESATAGEPGPSRRPAATGSPFRFTALLGLVFLLFWVNLWSVRIVGLWGPQDNQAGWRLLAAFFLGPPVALFYWLRRHRSFEFAGEGGGTARREQGAPCQFYTWENEPLKASRKAASGLNVAQEVFSRAIASKASDVHFNTGTGGVKVAMRVDGVLHPPEMLAADTGRKVMAAVKMAAGLDMAKRHETQDGACRLKSGESWYDLRIARAWAVEGETLVVRILRAGGEATGLTDFGMSREMAALAAELAAETSGIIILAGPTGSGKTTTIYGILKLIEGTGRNILTIEDPVEHRLQNATQISLNTKAGGTFANALRASMRHDPDVILVGEIRDADTMDVAFQAALTGHLVFTTLHATGLMAVVGRLRELGLSAYMIKTGLKAIVCQRLVRKLCPSCRQTYLPDVEELRFWQLDPEKHQGTLFYRPQGCHLCADTGYHGRTGVFRMVVMDNEMRARIQNEIEVETLQKAIEVSALGSVSEYALRLLAEGETSPDELRRTLGMFDHGIGGMGA
ncbi:MAG: GspE/PulE family protein [Lentisphaeria bacterium]|nr:GspE/PulE family protein [Lentisphaeria bacterium]